MQGAQQSSMAFFHLFLFGGGDRVMRVCVHVRAHVCVLKKNI